MCCRPYRMQNLPDDLHSWWEVDSDLELLHVKRSVLQAAGCTPRITLLGDNLIDLACPQTSLADVLRSQPSFLVADTTLTSSGSTTHATTTTDWIVEGLFAYLELAQHAKILQETASMSTRGSRMALTVAEPAFSIFWGSLGVTLPYQVLVPVEDVLAKAQRFGWVVDEHIQPHDWSKLYPGRGEKLHGYHLVFLVKE